MKARWMRNAFVAAAVLAAGPVAAAQTGGLASPLDVGGLAVSATLGYAQRDVKDGRDDQLTDRSVLFRAEVGVADGLDLYGILGFTDADLDHADFAGTLGESFGVGVRYGLLNFPESALQVVLDLQGEYFRSRDGDRDLRTRAYHAATYLVREIGAAGRVGYIYPFGGVRLSYARADGGGGVDDVHSDDLVGIFGGADYFVNPNVFFSGEVHLFDETSLYLGVGYRF